MRRFSLYDICYLLSLPVITPPILYKMLFKKKYRTSFRGMIGKDISENDREMFSDARTCWIHAVSVGEVVAAQSIIREFKTQFPEYKILVSTVTETGHKKAHDTLKEADRIIFFPIDFSPVVRNFLSVYQPDVCILMESELWPNFLRLAQKQGSRIFLCNGKMSKKSFSMYRTISFVFKKTLSGIDAFFMQTEEDAEKFFLLTHYTGKIFVTGNCKFDSAPQPLSSSERDEMLRTFRFSSDARLLVVGSTHQDEEKIILDAFEKVRNEYPHIKMIISPRHPERFTYVREMLTRTRWKVSCASDPSVDNPDIFFLDQMGKLARVYGLGQIALVGGSFVPIGGHNLLEPLAHKVPVVYGPHVEKQKEIVRMVETSGGGVRCEAPELTNTLLDFLRNEEKRREMGERGFNALSQSTGSARRTIELMKTFIPGR